MARERAKQVGRGRGGGGACGKDAYQRIGTGKVGSRRIWFAVVQAEVEEGRG